MKLDIKIKIYADSGYDKLSDSSFEIDAKRFPGLAALISAFVEDAIVEASQKNDEKNQRRIEAPAVPVAAPAETF